MVLVTNGGAIFNEIPENFPILGKTITYIAGTIELENVGLNGGVLVKTLYLSIDPHLRLMMRAPEVKSTTVPAYQLGKPIWGHAIVSVLRSEREGLHKGDILYLRECPFQEYSVLSADLPVRVVKPEPDIPLSAYLSVLGMPGQTAFYGLELIGNLKPGEIIYISAGAGAVGSAVAQLAKSKGLKVIASAGSDKKVDFLKRIGVDVAFNYNVDKVADVLAKEGPIDIFWDHIGGATLEAVLDACNLYAHVIVCGAILDYNDTAPYPLKNLSQILFKRLRVQGFMVWEAEPEIEGRLDSPVKFLDTFTPLVKSGVLRWNEQVFEGIDRVGEATAAVHTGTSTAKVVVKVAEL